MYKNEGPCPRIASSLCQYTSMAQADTIEAVRHHLHVSRMGTYMREAANDSSLALELYLWNGRMSAAIFETLSVTEVLFRNTIDASLRTWNASRGTEYSEEWTAKPAPPLNSLIRKALGKARTNAQKARAHRLPNHPRKFAAITHDDLVAQLTFGVYTGLIPTLDETDPTHKRRLILWNEALSAAFQGRPHEGMVTIAGRVQRLHALRNRVAHAEPILHVNFRSRARDMARLAESANPRLAGWVSGNTRIHEVLRERPSRTSLSVRTQYAASTQ